MQLAIITACIHNLHCMHSQPSCISNLWIRMLANYTYHIRAILACVADVDIGEIHFIRQLVIKGLVGGTTLSTLQKFAKEERHSILVLFQLIMYL